MLVSIFYDAPCEAERRPQIDHFVHNCKLYLKYNAAWQMTRVKKKKLKSQKNSVHTV